MTNKTASRQIGFNYGMMKIAAGDNQPGPQFQDPAPPDSHRKRNVALGAGVLAAGLFGGRHLYKTQNNLATSILKGKAVAQHADEGKKILGGISKAKSDLASLRNHGLPRMQALKQKQDARAKALVGLNKTYPATPEFKERIKGLGQKASELKKVETANLIASRNERAKTLMAARSKKRQALNNAREWQATKSKVEDIKPTFKEKFNALREHYKKPSVSAEAADKINKQKAVDEARDLSNKQFFESLGDHGKDIEKDVGNRVAKLDPKNSKLRKARNIAIGGALIGGGAVAGASGASKAREPQDDSQYGN